MKYQVIDSTNILEEFKVTKFHQIEKVIHSLYDFRRNVVTGFIEFREKNSQDTIFRELKEKTFNSIFCKIGRKDISCTLNNFLAILNSDLIEDYDPFLDYFTSLTWDNKTDYIKQLADTVKTDNQELWNDCLKRWLVATVACCTENKPNHNVLVLSGAQGIGKTTWLNGLLPKPLGNYIYTGTIHTDSKDSLINMAETMFINLDELENLNRYEVNTLKSLITLKNIRIRRPYARITENLQRRTSFMGSLNDVEFLTDVTGNRRYLCFTALDINFNHNIDLDKVYGQVYSLLQNGENNSEFKYWFDGADLRLLEENNSKYRRISVEEELVNKYFSVPSPGEEVRYYTPTKIISLINSWENNRILDQKNMRKLGQVLYALGFKKKSIENSKPYELALTASSKSFL